MLAVIVLCGIAIVPRLAINYGVDPDAVLGVIAAEKFMRTGVYYPSRLPGNPLFEYILAVPARFGNHIWTNLCVLAFYVLCVHAFSLVTRREKVHPFTCVLFTLTPIIMLNAATTMDYLPGLALMLYSFACLGRSRFILGSVLLGLSIGFRLSNGLLLLPYCLFLFMNKRRLDRVVLFYSISIITGLSFYIPIFIQDGFRMFIIPPSYYAPYGIIYRLYAIIPYKALMLFGPLASVGILACVFAGGKKRTRAVIDYFKKRDAAFITALLVVLLYAFLFIIKPDETEYLIPVVPFVWLILAKLLPSRQFLLIGILIISYGVLNLELRGGESGRRNFALKPNWGIVINDYIKRIELEQLRNGLDRFSGAEPAVILTGMERNLTYRNPNVVRMDGSVVSPKVGEDGFIGGWYRVKNRDVFLIHSLPEELAAALIEEGYNLWIFSEYAPGHTFQHHGYDPYALGIKRLDILNEHAFYK